MADEKPYKYEPLPIPSYEEATGSSSRGSTPLLRPDNEDSIPAEREGLLYNDAGGRLPVPTRRVGYRPPPTVGNSPEHDTFLGQDDRRRSSEDSVRREMEEMDIVEPSPPQSAWGKRISSLGQSLSSRLPRNWRIPKIKLVWPKMDVNMCILLSRIFAIFLVVGVVYLLFMSDLFPTGNGRMAGQMYDPEDIRKYVQTSASGERIRERLQKITLGDHLAGTEGDYALASFVRDVMLESKLEDVRMDEYGVFLNYAKAEGRKVELLGEKGEVVWAAGIEEPKLYNTPPRAQTPVYHGHSKDGDVKGALIYANYGTREDFKRLYDSGIDTKGAIALVRSSGGQGEVGYKVKAAETWGFVGCIVYSDPAEDKSFESAEAPDGRRMPKDGVNRGSTSLSSWILGDVLTPGWASKKGAKRIPKEDNPGLVNIPSIPLSWGDAQYLLQAIQGFGNVAPEEWQGAVPDVIYWSGNLSAPQVHLVNKQDEVKEQKIWNVMGKITGVEQGEKSVIIGNHRDAWAFGATSPGSGTAIFLEMVYLFADLNEKGWKPLRTIEFASWDGGEHNMIGSTEHVEANLENLRAHAFAYLNVDAGVAGQEFYASGSPLFKKSLLRVLDRTSDLSQNKTMRQLWDDREGRLEGLDATGDYVAFQEIAGTSSLNIGFRGAPYPANSAFDNFEWMSSQGDPSFSYHTYLSQILGLLVLEISDRLVLPFDIKAYSAALKTYAVDLENWVGANGANQAGNAPWSTDKLREAVLRFDVDAKEFDKWEMNWDSVVLAGGGFEHKTMASHRQSHNTRMANFETHLLDLAEGGGVGLFHSLTSVPTNNLTSDPQPNAIQTCPFWPASLAPRGWRILFSRHPRRRRGPGLAARSAAVGQSGGDNHAG